MINKHVKVWKVVFHKSISGKQTSQKEKHFPGNQTKFFFDWKVFSVDRKVFPLTRKCFPFTNFSNGKQTQESLESDFMESEFWKTNIISLNITSYLTLVPRPQNWSVSNYAQGPGVLIHTSYIVNPIILPSLSIQGKVI